MSDGKQAAGSKSERTKLAILEAASLTLSQRPDATLNDIAEAAGIGRATLHRHYKSREELLRILAVKCLDEVQQICQPALEKSETAREALERIITDLVPLGHQYRFMASDPVAYSDGEVRDKYDAHLWRLTELAEDLKQEGALAPDVPAAWVVAVIDSLIYAAWFSVEGGYVARRDAAALVLRTILGGLGASKDG